jgi:hypothetical protein
MKRIFASVLLTFILQASFSQIWTIENENIKYDNKNKTIKGEIGGISFDGQLVSMTIGYEAYYILENSLGTIAFNQRGGGVWSKEKDYLTEFYVAANPSDKLIKAIKTKRFSKLDLKVSEEKVTILNVELLKKKDVAQKQLDSNISIHKGLYKVQILTSSGIKLTNQFGKLYITDAGITLKTEIATMTRVSGSYELPFNYKVEEGTLYGNLASGTLLYDIFVLSINEEGTAAGLTLANDRFTVYDTTTMVLLEKSE